MANIRGTSEGITKHERLHERALKKAETTEIQLNPKTLSLVTSLEADLNKAISEALDLWLKNRVTVCPITNKFCDRGHGQCNDCAGTKT